MLPLQELRELSRLTKPAVKSPPTMGVKTTLEHLATEPVECVDSTRGGQREPCVLCEAQDPDPNVGAVTTLYTLGGFLFKHMISF